MEKEQYNHHGDKRPWYFHSQAKKHFIYEGWLNDVGLIDGHLPAENEKLALEILKRLGTFKWVSLRFICNQYNPWNKDISEMALHQGDWVGEFYDGDVDEYQCKHCKTKYLVGH